MNIKWIGGIYSKIGMETEFLLRVPKSELGNSQNLHAPADIDLPGW
ncbi:MAG: hypothetical protein WAV76_09005 [Bacteroidota bacterium]